MGHDEKRLDDARNALQSKLQEVFRLSGTDYKGVGYKDAIKYLNIIEESAKSIGWSEGYNEGRYDSEGW